MPSVMGVAGFATALKVSKFQMLLPFAIGAGIFALAILLLFAASFVTRMVGKTASYYMEMENVVSYHFLSCTTISLFLLSGLFETSWIWIVGAFMQSMLFLIILYQWLRNRKSITNMFNPTFLIPALANVVGAIFAPHALRELGLGLFWVGISIGGLIYGWLLIRLARKRIVARPLLPSYFILLATPSMFFLSSKIYVSTSIWWVEAWYWVAIITSSILVFHLKAIVGGGFTLAFWALTFPVAAFTTATYQYLTVHHHPLWVGHGLLAVSFCVTAYVLHQTIAMRRKLLLPRINHFPQLY